VLFGTYSFKESLRIRFNALKLLRFRKAANIRPLRQIHVQHKPLVFDFSFFYESIEVLIALRRAREEAGLLHLQHHV